MTLSATIDADYFRDTIDAVSALVKDCRLHVDEDGIHIYALDSANVAMIRLDLGVDAFGSINIDPPAEFGIDIEKIRGMMSLIRPDDVVAIDYDPEGNRLTLRTGSPGSYTQTREGRHHGPRSQLAGPGYEYSIRLLDTKTIRKDPNPPNLELPAVFEVAGSLFADTIKAAGGISDKIFLISDGLRGNVVVDAATDTDSIRRTITGDDVKFTTCADARSLFSFDYLKDMSKSIGRADKVLIQLGTDRPAQFSFAYADGNGKIEYLLAPRIENTE